MLGDLIAAAIGRDIDRRDGKGGAIGALAGVASWRVAKRVIPAAMVVGAAVLGARYVKRKLDDSSSAA